MNIAVILAGGKGQRFGAEIPKQFIEVYNKPIIVYTLEAFEKHNEIDAIEVVCIEGYEKTVLDYAKKYNISKLKWITTGGLTCQESIRNGIYNLEGIINNNDIIILHMAANPLIEDFVISDCIKVTKEFGNAASADPVLAFTFCVTGPNYSEKYIPRDDIKLLTMPLGYKYGEMLSIYKQAYREEKGIYGNVYADTLYVDYGKKVYFSKSSRRNIKITTQEDINLFKAYLKIIEGENNE